MAAQMMRSRNRSRSRQRRELSGVKAFKYEDVPERTPPLQVTTIHQTRSSAQPSEFSTAAAAHDAEDRAKPPAQSSRSSPALAANRTSYLSQQEVKRDSAFAPSDSVGKRASSAASQQDAPGLERIPSHTETMSQGREDEARLTRIRSPLRSLRSRSRKGAREQRPKDDVVNSRAPPIHEKSESFHGIDTTIATGSDLADLTGDKVQFSNRGSMLLGGKKMAELLKERFAQQDEMPPLNSDAFSSASTSAQGATQPGSSETAEPSVKAENEVDEPKLSTLEENEADHPRQARPEEHASDLPDVSSGDPKQSGLVAGRRRPSVNMLQAAIHGGRVLSAEEITFSMRVRSMYERGEEQDAEWVGAQERLTRASMPATASSAPAGRPEGAVDTDTGEETVMQPAGEPEQDEAPPSDLPLQTASANCFRQPNETAGGVEDWKDVDGRDVDRYGFIKASHTRSASGALSSDGFQSVATALKVNVGPTRGPRKLTKAPSARRLSRSLPPSHNRRRSAEFSITSLQSNISRQSSMRHSIFRSKEQKVADDASEMLYVAQSDRILDEVSEWPETATMSRSREYAREEKWRSMAIDVSKLAPYQGGERKWEFNTNDPKLVSRTWKGIPDRWRATAWHSFLTASAKKRGLYVPDEELTAKFVELQEESSADDVQIDMDVPRTISMHIMFRRRYRGGQRLLFRVLHAISLHRPDTGYVQGMASLAATLLCYYDEEMAFVMMVRLWELRGLSILFQPGFAGLMAALDDFEKNWLGGGEVARKLQDLGITSMTYGTRWYLTLFNLSIPFAAQLRVWDVFMLLGDAPAGDQSPELAGTDLDVLHATSAALIDATRAVVLVADFENVMKVLTSFVPIKNEDMLMRVTRAEWKMRKKRAGVRV